MKANDDPHDRHLIRARNGKSLGLAFLLTLVFGPVGLFYSSIVGGIFMVTIAIIIALVTMSWGFLLTWPLSIVWGVVATIAHERT